MGSVGGHELMCVLAWYWCTYVEMWLKVKSTYALTITSAEKTALTSMLATCWEIVLLCNRISDSLYRDVP